jgi:hypothetical protein
MQLWSRLVGALKAVGGAIMPMFAAARDFRRLSPVVRWLLHALALAVVLAVFWLIHYGFDLDRYLWLPHPALRNLWLPLLFLLVYALCWLGRWLWDLIGPEQESSVFPEIEKAWREAVRALDQAGVDLTSSPLFLVLGRPQRSEEALFQGVQPKLLVNQAPRQTLAPIHVYANREGIYVACSDASLMGRQAALLTDEAYAASPTAADRGGTADAGASVAMYATLSPTGQRSAEAVEAIIARAREQGRGVGQLLEEERRAIGLLTAAGEGSDEREDGRARVSLLQDRAEVENQSQRLQFLCRLIARERRPFCPINGVLLVIPIVAGQSDEGATQLGLIAQRDLATVRKTLQVRCPVFALVCDLETLPGFRELTARLPEGQRDRRMGQRFPLVPDIEPTALPAMLESGVQQIGNRLIPNLVSTLWRIESASGGSVAEAVRGNIELYHLLQGVRDRQNRIARVLTRVVLSDSAPPAMLGGCYFAGTGPDPSFEQAFIPGVFRRLTESQDFVSWTPEALANERSYERWTRFGYVALGLLTAACLGFAAYVLLLKKG